MSRWGKNRLPSYALPIDALVKEKENTNRPVAARSAGTVGKWGITSFTSIRARPAYGFASFSPNQDASFQFPNFSPKSPTIDGSQLATGDQQSPNNNIVVKPKKFFKSRNSVPDADAIVTALADPHAAAIATPSNISLYANSLQAAGAASAITPTKNKLSVKVKKKKTKSTDDVATATTTTKKTKAEKPPKVEKPPKPQKPEKLPKPPKPEKVLKSVKKKPAKTIEVKIVDQPKPTRVLSRTRKVVNYSEDRSRTPSPKSSAPIETTETHSLANELIPSPIQTAQFINNEFAGATESFESKAIQSTSDHNKLGESSPTAKNAAIEHPPIVLRISKGTSRLISTDSEGINNSPPYLSPIQPGVSLTQSPLTNLNYSSAAANLVAVLSDDPPAPFVDAIAQNSHIDNTNIVASTPTKATHKTKQKAAKPIKIKIKTNAAKSKNNNDLVNPVHEKEVIKATRTSARRQQLIENLVVNDKNISEPGTANYELYRTLSGTSPEDKDFDSQSSLLGSVGSTFVAPGAITHTPVDLALSQCRTLTDPETSQASALMVAPSEIDVRLAELQSSDVDINLPLSPDQSIVPKKRRARNKSKIESNISERAVDEPVVKKQRNRKKQEENLPVAIEPEPEKTTVRKRITAAAKKQYKDDSDVVLPNLPSIDVLQTPELIETAVNEEVATEPVAEIEPVVAIESVHKTRGRKPKKVFESPVKANPKPEAIQRSSRATRHNTNGNMMQEKEQSIAIPPVTRSYGRKRKQPSGEQPQMSPVQNFTTIMTNDASLVLSESEQQYDPDSVNVKLPFADPEIIERHIEPKRTRSKRQTTGHLNGSNNEQQKICNNNDNVPAAFDEDIADKNDEDSEKPSVKLVISKKKGSIFKSRAIDVDSGENKKPKRHVYKHKWDDDLLEEKAPVAEAKTPPAVEDQFENDFDMVDTLPKSVSSGPNTSAPLKFSRSTRSNVPDDDLRIRNVKKAHQMQEIGEFQEMDDDVEYILESLKSQNPMATRSLAAIQFASKCMTPAFRMHVRAHGTATKFFNALHDATQNQSLGLCTATIMFVLIQDNLNMDLDKHSLELMLNLLDSDISRKNNYKETGLTDEQSQRNEQKVIEICREIKSQGKAVHLNLENISIGTLAMETLLTLTSKRAGEWFKDELRTLGGIEHIIDTICECCKQISDYVVDWTEVLLEKLRKIERCLRVLENVSDRNEDNQKYILFYKNGHAVETLVKFYKLCDSEIALYPTNETTPAENPGVVLREALVPTLKVLINLTHTFNNKPLGSVIFGENPIIFDTSLHLLFQAPQYVPEKCIFELSLLVLLLLINLTVHSVPNRTVIMESCAPFDFGNQFVKVPAIKALIEYFYKYEELARFVEQNTDDILNNPEKCDKSKHKSQEEIEETVSTLLKKAGNHMEHTMLASYVCLLVGHLVMECKPNETKMRTFLRNQSFAEMVQILEKYYNFMNLTASSEPIQKAHMKETKRIIQYLKDSDMHSTTTTTTTTTTSDNLKNPVQLPNELSIAQQNSAATSTASTRLANSSGNSGTSCNNSNSIFNKVYHSGR